MRIAVYHNLPSGGGKRALYEMVRGLAGQHEVDVYTLSCAEHDFCDLRPHSREHVIFPFEPLRLARRPFGRLNQGIRALDLIRLRAVQRRVAARIDAGGYDVAFVHHCRYGQAPSVLQFLGTPSAYYCQEPPRMIYEPPVPRPYAEVSTVQRLGNRLDPLPATYRALLKVLDRASVRAASLVLVNSHFSRESLYRVYGILARVCYLGVDVGRFRPLPVSKEDFCLSVGALNPRKGFDFLICSLALIKPERRPGLVIACNAEDPREQAYLQDLARDLAVQVQFRRLVSDEELVQLYNQAALTLYAPIMEPFGFVPIESMACGTPVVGVVEGGVRETVIHGVTGLLVERDPRLFAEAVEGLLRQPALARELGARGPGYVREDWSWEASVAWLELMLVQATKEAGTSAGRCVA